MPYLLRPLEDLHSRTRKNLKELEKVGFQWSPVAYAWRTNKHLKPVILSTKRLGFRVDQMIPGYHQEIGKFQYWRHETASIGAGQTFILFRTEEDKLIKCKVTHLVENKGAIELLKSLKK